MDIEITRRGRAASATAEPPQWEQTGGDADPLAHGGFWTRRDDGGGVDWIRVQSTRDLLGDSESREVGAPWWVASGHAAAADWPNVTDAELTARWSGREPNSVSVCRACGFDSEAWNALAIEHRIAAADGVCLSPDGEEATWELPEELGLRSEAIDGERDEYARLLYGLDTAELAERLADVRSDCEHKDDCDRDQDCDSDCDCDDVCKCGAIRSVVVRLVLRPEGDVELLSGDSQYDQDHRGHWGASSVASDTDTAELAEDLISQVLEDLAEAGWTL